MSTIGGHILSEFNESLIDLRDQLLSMGRLARTQVENSIRGLLERDTDLCNTAIADDDAADEFENTINEAGMAILIKFRPVASDLRFVLTAISVSRNLERISDHAVTIARRSKKLLKNELADDVNLAEPLYQSADRLLADSITAFATSDVGLAKGLHARNEDFRREVKNTVKKLTKMLENDASNAKFYMHLIFVCRSLERVGELSVNVSEDAVFNDTANQIKHSQ